MKVGYEAAVAGVVPVIGNLRHLLHVNTITKIEAVLNGTSNFILSQMREQGLEFEHALQLAKEKGFAEPDPSNDIDGWDAFYKIMILSDLLFDKQPDWSETFPVGIREVTSKEVNAASAAGYRLKQIASISVKEGKAKISVEVKAMAKRHHLFEVEGVDNAVVIEGDLARKIKLQGPGAGADPTASAIIHDLSAIYHISDYPSLQTEITFSAIEDGVRDWLAISREEDFSWPSDWEYKLMSTACRNVWRVTTDRLSIQKLLSFEHAVRFFPIAEVQQKGEEALPDLL